MNISSKRFHKIKYKIKNQSAKKYRNKHKHKHKHKKGGYLSRKKYKKYNLKNKSMKKKRKMQKGGDGETVTIKDDFKLITGATIGNLSLTSMPIRATLSDNAIIVDIKKLENAQTELTKLERDIDALEKTKPTANIDIKKKMKNLSELDLDFEKGINDFQETLTKSITAIKDSIDMKETSTDKKETPAFIHTDVNKKVSIYPFYSMLIMNNNILYGDGDKDKEFLRLIKDGFTTLCPTGVKCSRFDAGDKIDRRIIEKSNISELKLKTQGNTSLNNINLMKGNQSIAINMLRLLSTIWKKQEKELDGKNFPTFVKAMIIKDQEEKEQLNIDAMKKMYKALKPFTSDITLISQADNSYPFEYIDGQNQRQLEEKLGEDIDQFIQDRIDMITNEEANIKLSLLKARKKLKKLGREPRAIPSIEGKGENKRTVFSDLDGNATKFKDCGDGKLKEVAEDGSEIGECMSKEEAEKISAKKNEAKNEQKIRDKLGMNIYLPQTQLSEKESLYYNINLNQKRENVFGQIMPNTSYNDYNQNLYGPAQSTTLGWLLHGPDNLGLDKVDGLDANIQIDGRGQYTKGDGKLAQKKKKKGPAGSVKATAKTTTAKATKATTNSIFGKPSSKPKSNVNTDDNAKKLDLILARLDKLEGVKSNVSEPSTPTGPKPKGATILPNEEIPMENNQMSSREKQIEINIKFLKSKENKTKKEKEELKKQELIIKGIRDAKQIERNIEYLKSKKNKTKKEKEELKKQELLKLGINRSDEQLKDTEHTPAIAPLTNEQMKALEAEARQTYDVNKHFKEKEKIQKQYDKLYLEIEKLNLKDNKSEKEKKKILSKKNKMKQLGDDMKPSQPAKDELAKFKQAKQNKLEAKENKLQAKQNKLQAKNATSIIKKWNSKTKEMLELRKRKAGKLEEERKIKYNEMNTARININKEYKTLTGKDIPDKDKKNVYELAVASMDVETKGNEDTKMKTLKDDLEAEKKKIGKMKTDNEKLKTLKTLKTKIYNETTGNKKFKFSELYRKTDAYITKEIETINKKNKK